MTHHISAAIATLSLLSACGLPPLADEANAIDQVAQPSYILGEDHVAVPTSCRRATRGGFGALPPGCARDVAFANQVAHPSDLVQPRQARLAPSRPAADAAYRYIYGVDGPQGVQPQLTNEAGRTVPVSGDQPVGGSVTE